MSVWVGSLASNPFFYTLSEIALSQCPFVSSILSILTTKISFNSGNTVFTKNLFPRLLIEDNLKGFDQWEVKISCFSGFTWMSETACAFFFFALLPPAWYLNRKVEQQTCHHRGAQPQAEDARIDLKPLMTSWSYCMTPWPLYANLHFVTKSKHPNCLSHCLWEFL